MPLPAPPPDGSSPLPADTFAGQVVVGGIPGRGHAEDPRTPAHRVGHPRELGWAAVFLRSPRASYVSGHTFVVDGASWQPSPADA